MSSPWGRIPSSGVTVGLLASLSKGVGHPKASGDLSCGVQTRALLKVTATVWEESTEYFVRGPAAEVPRGLRTGLEPLGSLPALLPVVSDGHAKISSWWYPLPGGVVFCRNPFAYMDQLQPPLGMLMG